MLENEHPRAKTVPIQPKAVQFLPSFSEQLTKLIDFVSLTNLPVFRREAALREEASKKEAAKREATVRGVLLDQNSIVFFSLRRCFSPSSLNTKKKHKETSKRKREFLRTCSLVSLNLTT